MIKIFKNNFFWGGMLSVLLVIGFVSVTVGKTTIPTIPQSPEHEAWLHSLTLSKQSIQRGSLLKIFTGDKKLDILSGLNVGNRNTIGEAGEISLSVIGGGSGNEIGVSNAGIGGGVGNRVKGEGGAIGGGRNNMVEGLNGVVVGGTGNKVIGALGVVVGGYLNVVGSKGVILGGENNYGGSNSLAMGYNATGGINSFAWNGVAQDRSARIDSVDGVLIGTHQGLGAVKLVVSGAVKLRNYSNRRDFNNDGKVDGSDVQFIYDCIYSTGCNHNLKYDLNNDFLVTSSDITDMYDCILDPVCGKGLVNGGIVFRNGRIVMYDGSNYRILGRTGSSLGDDSCGCWFGGVKLEAGDVVKMYASSYATNCEAADNVLVGTCKTDGELDVVGYPYCYQISSDPRGTGEKISQGEGGGGGGLGAYAGGAGIYMNDDDMFDYELVNSIEYGYEPGRIGG